MKLSELKDYTLFDTETTGLDINNDRIVEYGCMRYRNNEPVDQLRVIAKQPIPVPVEASNIHGITTDIMNKEGIDPKEACQKVLDFMGDDYIGGLNNIPYDHPMLETECNRLGLPRPKIEKWFDIGMLHKGIQIGNIWNGEELFCRYAMRIRDIRARGVKYSLDHLVKTYEVENLRDDGFHGAIKDIRMCGFVFKVMQDKYPTI